MSLTSPSLSAYYSSIAEAIGELNSFAATEGYAIVKRRTNDCKGVIKRVDLKCDKGCKTGTPIVDDDNKCQHKRVQGFVKPRILSYKKPTPLLSLCQISTMHGFSIEP